MILKGAQEKYAKFYKQRRKRDITTSAPDAIESRVNQTYQNMVQALENNVNNQTLSSLNVEGLSTEELKADEYSFELFSHSIKEHNIDAVKLLIAKGANTNVRDERRGATILHIMLVASQFRKLFYL